MTLPAAVSHVEYVGNNATTVYTYPFQIDINTELEVRLDGNLQTKDFHYTVTGVGSPTGGTITMLTAPDNNEILSIRRVNRFEQTLALIPNSALPATSLEGRLDEHVKMVQLLEEEDSRRPQLPVGSKTAFRYLEFPTPETPSRLLGTDAAGLGYTTYPITGTVTSVSIDHIGNYNNSLNTAIAAIGGGHTSLFIDKTITLTGNLTVPYNIELFFTRQGNIDLNGFTLTINGQVRSGGFGIFGDTGTVIVSPQVLIDPVWFATSGAGVSDNPWTSSDGSGGFIRAFKALQFRGRLKASPGWYRFTSATPAEIDLAVNSEAGGIDIDMTGAFVRIETTGTVFKLNKNGNVGAANTNLNTIFWHGGFLTTGTHGQGDTSVTIRSIMIDATRTRNITIEQVKFLGAETAIRANVADTFTIRENSFRRCKHAVHFAPLAAVDIPQDIWIENNTQSNSNMGAVEPTYFIKAEHRIAHVTIAKNAIANDSDDSAFVYLVTGDANGDSQNISIVDNATEQFETGSHLIHVVRSGTTELLNLFILRNQFDSSLQLAPFDDGPTAIDLEYIKGSLVITDNQFPNAAVTAIRLDNFRTADSGNPGSVGRIEGNVFNALASFANAKLFDITNIVTPDGALTIGRNSTANFYTGGIAPLIYPPNIRFETARSPASAIAAAATMTFSPWDDFIEINGATIITSINPTWNGHVVTLLFQTADGGLDDGNNLELSASFRARIPNESLITLRCDGTNWQELTRVSEQRLGGTIASANTISVPSYAAMVTISGNTDINTVNVNRNGQIMVFIGGTGAAATLKDGVGNLIMSADMVLNSNDTATLISDNASWYEIGRSNN